MILLSGEEKIKPVKTINSNSLLQNQQVFKPTFLIRVSLIKHLTNGFVAWHTQSPTFLQVFRASPAVQMVKNLPANRESWDKSLGWEDPMEKEIATILVFLPGEFHGQRSLVGYCPWCGKELDMIEQLTLKPWSII